MTVSEWIAYVDQRVWGPGMLVLLMGTGVFLTLRTRFLPWRNLGWALKSVLGRDSRAKAGGAGDVSPFSALMTTLAATIGTGNIVGVATALVAGGPGALVWMEISALFGLSSKCAECLLAVKYRQRDAGGEMRGGPMYTMCAALRWKRLGGALAFLFALFTVLASLGMGDMAQANSIARGAGRQLLRSGPDHRGGSGSAGSRGHSGRYPADCRSLLRGGAPHGGPLPAGGHRSAAGASVRSARSRGRDVPPGLLSRRRCGWRGRDYDCLRPKRRSLGHCQRLLFPRGGHGFRRHPCCLRRHRQPRPPGVCEHDRRILRHHGDLHSHGLCICASAFLGTADASGGQVNGVALTALAFKTVLGPLGGLLVSLGIVLFAFSTILGWEFCGETAFAFLFGRRAIPLYRILFALAAFLGATQSLEVVWNLSDIFNALMAVPNLISLLFLSGTAARELEAFQPEIRRGRRLRQRRAVRRAL